MKKVLSLIVALSMVLAICAPAALSAEGETGYTDVDGTVYEAPVSILKKLGIMTGYADGSFHPYSTVTRAEMAVVCLHMLKITDYGEIVSLDEVQYNDMEGHWAAAAVAYARSLGIIDGHQDGNFYPEDPVTYEQAIKMIVATLGYNDYATLNGGYPTGYIRKANELGLTRSVGYTTGSYITRGDVARIVYNSLTADIMQVIGYQGDGDVVYGVINGDNILNTYFDIVRVRGIVNDNGRTAINSETTVKENQVRIGEEVFYDGGTGIGDYIGYYVSFYALDNGYADNRTIVAYQVESSKNSYITIDAEKIENVSLLASRYVFEYWRDFNDKSTKTVRTSATPLVIFNGVAYTDYTVSDLNPDYGQVTLLDNDGDGIYDIIDIMDYDIMVVVSASETTGNIVGSYSTGARSFALDTENENYTVRIMDGSGNAVPFSQIRNNSVIHFALSRDPGQTVRTVIVSNKSVSGTVNGRDRNGNIRIEGTSYESYDFVSDNYSFSMGDNGTFYLGYDGRIAGYDGESKLSSNVGYFIACNAGTPTTGGNTLKVLTSNGTVQIFTLASTVNYNGEKVSGRELFNRINNSTNPLFGSHSDSANANKVIARPDRAAFMYKADRDNTITEMVTYESGRIAVNRIKTGGGDWSNSTMNYSATYHGYYMNDTGATIHYIDDNAVLFYSADNWQKTDDNQIYSVASPGRESSNYWPDYYFYYVDGSTSASFAVLYDGYDTQGTESLTYYITDARWNVNVKIVDQVIETYDENHDVGYRMVYWDGGTQRTLDFHPDRIDAGVMYRDGANGVSAVNGADDGERDQIIANHLWRRGDMVNVFTVGNKIVAVVSIFGSNGGSIVNWNEPSDIELSGEKERNHRYMFPLNTTGSPWVIVNNWADGYARQNYIVGRVTSIDTVRQLSIMNVNGGTPEVSLENEPMEGNCFRFVYDSRGYLKDIENVGIGAIAPDQLVLVRKQGDYNRISFRMKETFILYEPDQFTEEQQKYYKGIYSGYEFF
ncbi:MAG: S-layer homology domain-containing protein [Oscillospiraceae bacterium]|nr:S-layer homology domain-containing protein [Oscillospiraceae bacterium]